MELRPPYKGAADVNTAMAIPPGPLLRPVADAEGPGRQKTAEMIITMSFIIILFINIIIHVAETAARHVFTAQSRIPTYGVRTQRYTGYVVHGSVSAHELASSGDHPTTSAVLVHKQVVCTD